VLNGPIDNPRGSCTSCHGFAQIARVDQPTPSITKTPPPLNASPATLDKYFKNIKAATSLSPDYVSVDYSLQLQAGISRALDDASAGVTLPPGLTTVASPSGRSGRSGRSRPVAKRQEEIKR
jgi:hypothetical protein